MSFQTDYVGQRELFLLNRKLIRHYFAVKQLQNKLYGVSSSVLFKINDDQIIPILLFSSKILGLGIFEVIERCHGVGRHVSNVVVLSEYSRFGYLLLIIKDVESIGNKC